MPLYEYACKSCSHQFEVLVRNGSDAAECPACHAQTLERRFSVFAAHTGAGAPRATTPGPCGSCGDPRGPGACSLD